PAYGLLLDELAPGWRSKIGSGKDLPDLLADAISLAGIDGTDRDLDRLADRYDGKTLMAAEDERAAGRREELADMRRRFVEGPTLTLDFVRMNVEFDPGSVEALDTHGSVYPAMRLTDDWGVLTVTDGALIKTDWRSVVVPAPVNPSGTIIEGEGYTLEVVEGWTLVRGGREGDYGVGRTQDFVSDEPEEVSFSTPDGITIFGDYYAGRDSTAPMILLFHQGASNARAEYGPLAPRLLAAGYRLLAIDARRGGSRFGGENRTVAALEGDPEFSYCDCYTDLVAALQYASEKLGTEDVIVWGSSYSAALVLRLAVDYPDRIKAVLAFSPASGEPMAGCEPEPYAERTKVPVLILRPARELELDHVAAQAAEFEDMGLPVYVADPAVHASSMLNPERVKGDVEPAWARVFSFLQTLE
ncbi:MAG: alpha/beta fold hydrolase, partial [Rhodothermia bacterium]|nr:alpha/beta fold hydrolase [Rhodothermia bacterium]